MAEESNGVSKEFLKGAAGAVGGVVALWLIGWLSPVASFAHQAFVSLSTHLMAQSQWPNWSAYLVSLLAAIWLFSRARRYWVNRKDNHNRFNQFTYLGAVWRWRGLISTPHSMRAFCPVCDLALVYENQFGIRYEAEDRVLLHCEKCRAVPTNQSGSMSTLEGRVSREVDRLVRTGEWRSWVAEDK